MNCNSSQRQLADSLPSRRTRWRVRGCQPGADPDPAEHRAHGTALWLAVGPAARFLTACICALTAWARWPSAGLPAGDAARARVHETRAGGQRGRESPEPRTASPPAGVAADAGRGGCAAVPAPLVGQGGLKPLRKVQWSVSGAGAAVPVVGVFVVVHHGVGGQTGKQCAGVRAPGIASVELGLAFVASCTSNRLAVASANLVAQQHQGLHGPCGWWMCSCAGPDCRWRCARRAGRPAARAGQPADGGLGGAGGIE